MVQTLKRLMPIALLALPISGLFLSCPAGERREQGMSLPIMMQWQILQNHLNETEPENYLKPLLVLTFKQQSLIRTTFCHACVCTPGSAAAGEQE